MARKIDLTKLRVRLGERGKPLTQAELAKRLGRDQSTVSRWETGAIEPDGPALILLGQLEQQARKAPATVR